MPHKNALDQLKTYGPLAVRLDKLTDQIGEAPVNSKRWESKAKELLDFFKSNDLIGLVHRLAKDRYAYNRELAAITIGDLWKGWKALPYSDGHRDEYVANMRKYASGLDWTLPILVELFDDKCSGPVELATLPAWEMDYARPEVFEQFRVLMLTAGKSKFRDVRLAVVRRITSLYPDNDEARHVLDNEAMDFLVASTRDEHIKVRDWACFELWLDVENLSDAAEEAFRERLKLEDPGSDVYMEAVIGLARMTGDAEVGDIVRANLGRDDFGKGWVDAAEQSHSAEMLDILISARERLIAKDARVDDIDAVLRDWNE